VWVLLAAISLSACALMPEDSVVPPPIIPPVQVTYNTLVVTRGDIFTEMRQSGTVIAVEQHAVSLPTVGGTLVAMHVRRDMEVTAGQVLAEFDTEDLQKQAETLRRDLDLAQMSHNSARTNFNTNGRVYRNLIESSAVELQLLESRWAQTRDNYYIHNSISDTQFLEAQLTHTNNVTRIEEALIQARNRANDDSEVRRTRYALELAEERLRDVESRMESFTLVSPIDGIVVTAVHRNLNEFIRAGETLFVIADTSEFYITVHGTQARDFRAGMEVILEAQIRVPLPDGSVSRETIRFGGTVLSGAPEVRHRAGVPENTVLIEPWEWPEHVGLNMNIVVFLLLEARHDTVVIPLNAVTEFANYAFVRVYQDGITLERQVELGIRARTEVEVISGLQEGERIVVR
jgi:multidrug efflux pump subunit AcrA (membrane-fusion protein)